MKKITKINKKWKWMLLLTSVFLVVFTAVYAFVEKDKSYAAASYVIRDMDNNDISNSSYALRRFQDRFTIFSDEGVVKGTVEWTSSNEDVLSFYDSEPTKDNHKPTITGSSVNVQVNDIGTVGLTVSVNDGNRVVFSTNITLNTAFSINEYVATGNGNDGVTMAKIFSTDNRRALIMQKPGSWIDFGTSALTEPSYLNLNHGSAKQPADTNISVTWKSSNKDVVDVNATAGEDGRGRVIAIAAGSATLTVTYHEGNYDYTDSILVYVRPEITHNGNSYNGDNSDSGGLTAAEITNGDKLKVSVKFDNNPLESISNKIDWVIAKDSIEDGISRKVLVRDSKNNGVYKDEANLIWIPAENSYQLKARASVYTIQFYVHGTYTGFEEARVNTPGCRPVSISNQVKVPSDFRNKTILLNVGGQYRLPEGLNIADSAFDFGCFTISPDVVSSGTGSSVNANDYITVDGATNTITAHKMGSVTVTVYATDRCREINIPGVEAGNTITLTINISGSSPLSLNISQMTMSVGETQILYGILGSGQIILPEECEWSSDDENGTFIKIGTNGANETDGTQATITAVKATTVNNPVTVTLKWKTSEGITFTAYCVITVKSTSINPPVASGVHIFSDYNYNNPVADDEAVIYGNGATLTINGKKVNNRVFTAYTDILASYKYMVNNKGIVKASAGKVIVGITKSATMPEVNSKNKIIDTSASKIARAKIKNGQITVTAVGKEGGLVYLWVIDTGNKSVSAYCPINVKMAPKKLEIQDTSKKALKNIKLENGKSIDVHASGIVSGSTKTDDCTYTVTVNSKDKNYIQVIPNGDSGKEFTIKAIGLKNNKDTKTTVTFKCDQNGKKINFSVTVTK